LAATAVVVALAAAGCGGEEEMAAGDGPRKVPVETVAVEAETLRDTVTGTGTIEAVQTVELRAEVTGVVESLRFEEGSRVTRGEVLARIDAEPLRRERAARRSATEAAEARMRLAERTLERISTLHDRGSASPDELDRATSAFQEAESTVARLRAEAEALEERIADAEVRAPAGGHVSERLVDPGNFVEAGNPLAVLYTTDLLEIVFSLPESVAGRLETGQEVRARVASAGGDPVTGRIRFISPAIAPTTRTVLVKAPVRDAPPGLRPGAYAAVEVTVETRTDRPVVPEEALVSTRTGYLAFVVDDGGVARRRDVRIGLRVPGRVEIVDGLEVGETVVRAGHMALSDGDPVEVVEDLPGTGTGDLPR